MGKRRVDEQAVGQLVLPIGPCALAASNQAPLVEIMPPEVSTGADALGEERKRKWYSLYDKVCKKGTLYEAFKRVRANKGAPGCDGMTIAQVDERARISLANCIRCYCCHELCPEQAIELRQPWLGRLLARMGR